VGTEQLCQKAARWEMVGALIQVFGRRTMLKSEFMRLAKELDNTPQVPFAGAVEQGKSGQLLLGDTISQCFEPLVESVGEDWSEVGISLFTLCPAGSRTCSS
jgi:hypothetical protein